MQFRGHTAICVCGRNDAVSPVDEDDCERIVDMTAKFDKVNVMVIDIFSNHIAELLNELKSKIAVVVVTRDDRWEPIRRQLSFCPKSLFIIEKSQVDVNKFACLE